MNPSLRHTGPAPRDPVARRRPLGPSSWFALVPALLLAMQAGCGGSAAPDAGVDAGVDAPAADVALDAPRDATPVDAGCDGAAACDGECVALATDVHHCGACGNDCTALPGVEPSAVRCVAGACDVARACLPGRAHCTAQASDGCETDATTAAHCGACGVACAEPAPLCSMSGGAYACASGCGGATPTRCAMSCVNTQTDPAHCGACGNACPTAPHAAPTCASGQCALACARGFADCDGDASNGCETSTASDLANCGACGTACALPNATAVCAFGSCEVGTCDAGYHLCGSACASDTDVGSCGARCAPCPVPSNGVATCDGTACGVQCNPTFVLVASACAPVAPPRPVAPLSTATVTSRQPVFHWALAAGTDGAHVEVCRDRACATPVASFDASGTSGAPAADLPPGVLFWRLRSRVAGATGTAVSPTWQFTVGARSAPVNTSWGTTLDVNGDGYADAIVGAPEEQEGDLSGYAGHVYVYLGGAAGLSSTPARVFGCPDGGSNSFGLSVASAGDTNGDGYADVVVMALSGRAWVYLGGAAGLSGSPAVTLTLLDAPAGNMDYVVASGGDVNGDGYADVLVGSPGASGATGRVYVYLGSATGAASMPSLTLSGPDGPSGYFGVSAASAGDVNGDGYADVIVGASSVSSATGRAYLFLGGVAGLASAPATTLVGPDGVSGEFGRSVASAGDLNGDGYADVIVGAYRGDSGPGHAYAYLGGGAGLSSAPATMLTPPNAYGSYFGWSVSGAGDLNGDGYADVVVGANNVNSGAGAVYAYLGGAAGLASTAATTLAGSDGISAYFGWPVAGAGDVNGDGFADILVGALNASAGAGRAYVYQGSAAGCSTTPATTLVPSGGGRRSFGQALASLDAGDGSHPAETVRGASRPARCAPWHEARPAPVGPRRAARRRA